MANHRVAFTPSGLTAAVAEGTTVLDAARSLGVDLDSVCGGRGICGRCQVSPGIGSFPKWSIEATEASLSPPGPTEDDYQRTVASTRKRPIEPGDRLGCAATIGGDIVIDVPAASQMHRQVVRKEIDLGDLTLDPVVTLHYLDVSEAETGADLGDTEAGGAAVTTRIANALASQWDIVDCMVEPRLLDSVHAAAAAGTLTVALRGDRIVAVWPGFTDRIVGAAFDVGSTTIAGHLCDLATGEILATSGRMNPQIRFGEDLMSRVSYAMMNDGGAEAMTSAVRQALDELLGELLAASGDDRSTVVEIVAVGNPIMHHLLLGIDPTPLGQAPFPLATADAVETPAATLAIEAPNATVYVGPCLAGHVGADTTAAVLSEGPHRGEALQLLVDVGTNAEIVLGNRRRLFAASSPTGPAFEGAQISAGQRAAAGAIERVRVDRDTLEPRFKVIGIEPWSDDPDFTAGTVGITGICGSGIIEAVSELFLAGVIDQQGVITAAAADRSPRIEPDERTFRYRLTDSIAVTQADVRAIQLAKAALRAGIELLLEHATIESVDEIRLAGAFGAHIDPVHAMVLGLIPDCEPAKVRSVGNAAGSGALRALLSKEERAELEAVAKRITKIETATEPRFQDHFVAALALPHSTAATPNLALAVDLPTPSETQPKGRRRRRRPAEVAAGGERRPPSD